MVAIYAVNILLTELRQMRLRADLVVAPTTWEDGERKPDVLACMQRSAVELFDPLDL